MPESSKPVCPNMPHNCCICSQSDLLDLLAAGLHSPSQHNNKKAAPSLTAPLQQQPFVVLDYFIPARNPIEIILFTWRFDQMVTSHHNFFIYSFAKMTINPHFSHISWLLPCLGFISGLIVSKWEVFSCFTSQCFTLPPQLFHPHQLNECFPPQAGGGDPGAPAGAFRVCPVTFHGAQGGVLEPLVPTAPGKVMLPLVIWCLRSILCCLPTVLPKR